MNVPDMMHVIFRIPDAMICKSALPDFSLSKHEAESTRVAALDKLNHSFERDAMSWRDQ
jgi:hypothetical protein